MPLWIANMIKRLPTIALIVMPAQIIAVGLVSTISRTLNTFIYWRALGHSVLIGNSKLNPGRWK